MTDSGQGPDFGILLILASQEFIRELHADRVSQGFDEPGRTDGYVLRSLAEGPLTVTELATRLGITKQGAGQIVDDMQRRGYVRRRPDPDDGRARMIELDERGRAALAAARRFHHRYERRLAARYGEEAVATVRRLLAAMAGDPGPTVDTRFRPLFL